MWILFDTVNTQGVAKKKAGLEIVQVNLFEEKQKEHRSQAPCRWANRSRDCSAETCPGFEPGIS